jgi:tight adherence protein B
MNVLLIFIFLTVLGVILLAVAVGSKFLETQREKQVKSALKPAEREVPDEPQAEPIILHDRGPKSAFLNDLLARLKMDTFLQSRLSESALGWNVVFLVNATLICALAGFLIGTFFHVFLFTLLSQIALAVALGSLPWVYVSFRRRKRLRDFEDELPDALDFLARSMRSGHAFSVGLEMLGNESPEPLGREFRALFNEQNLGAPLEAALMNLSRRVPLVDVNLFVSAVLLQRQTGGNLAELLNRLSYVIRERFRLRAMVRAVSAHGRITAAVLTLLPIVTMIGLHFVAPGYLEGMANDADGKYLLVASFAAQIVGFFVIKRIIDIKV